MPEAPATLPLSSTTHVPDVAGDDRSDDGRPDSLVTSSDLATLLRVSERTLRRMLALGAIGPRPFRLHKGCRWRRETIDQWLLESERRGELIDRREWQIMHANNEVGRPSPQRTIHTARTKKGPPTVRE